MLRCGRTVAMTVGPWVGREGPVSFYLTARRSFVEHSTDPKKWRRPENHRARLHSLKDRTGKGVPLGSAFVGREELEAQLRTKDDTNWDLVIYVSIGVALAVISLNVWVDHVCRSPSPTDRVAPVGYCPAGGVPSRGHAGDDNG